MRLNPRMWVAALRIIPRVEQGEWRELDLVSRWLIASRGATLIMTFLSATLAALFAALVGGVDVVLYVLLALGLVLAHGSSNLFNDYWDYKQGVDEGNYFRAQYGPHPLLTGLMSERQLLVWAGATGVIALLIAAYLTFLRGPWVLVLTVAGAALMLTYAGKPFPLKRLGLGEPAVFLAWGPLMIGGSYWVLTGSLPAWVLVASLPYALGVTSVLFGKHIDKIEDDEAKGIRTLPVLLGEAPARYASIGLTLLMYGLTLYLVLAGHLALWILLVFLAVPKAWTAIRLLRQPRPEAPPPEYPAEAWPLWFVGATFLHNRTFGTLFVAGLLLDVLLRNFGMVVTLSLI